MPRYGRVALGGTFDRLHVGHEALLGTAFRLGRTVAIGLTSDGYLALHPKVLGREIAPARARRRALARWLSARYARSRWTIVPLQDAFGGSVEPGVDALVVSADTLDGGRAVNRERLRLGRRAVRLVVVPLVLAADLEPVSSRRIREGVIDRWGRLRGAVEIGFAASDHRLEELAAAGLRRVLPRARIARVRRRPRAVPLARAAREARGGRALGVAVAPARGGGWRVAVQGRHLALRPRVLPGRTATDLAQGLARLLAPARPKRL